jgi:hypothetical protein
MTPDRDVPVERPHVRENARAPTERLDAEAPSMIPLHVGHDGKAEGTVHTHAGALAQMVKEPGTST